jgi:hypothetical protein
MIYKGPGFLVVVLFRPSPTPSPNLPSSSCLSFSVFLYVARRSSLLMGEGVEGGAKLYDREKAWSSINHPVLFAAMKINSTFTVLYTNIPGPQLPSADTHTEPDIDDLRYFLGRLVFASVSTFCTFSLTMAKSFMNVVFVCEKI